jgi:hypothetical protein
LRETVWQSHFFPFSPANSCPENGMLRRIFALSAGFFGKTPKINKKSVFPLVPADEMMFPCLG